MKVTVLIPPNTIYLPKESAYGTCWDVINFLNVYVSML